ncbi:MAG: quinol:cytochrome C oxidoreductase, partial [Acidobacteriota bacterium]
YFFSIGLGALFFVLANTACRAGWSAAVRRLAEHIAVTLPAVGILFAPLLIWGVHDLYPWTHSEAVAQDPLLQHKSPNLNLPFVYIRAIFYLLCWTFIAWWFRRESLRQDESGDPGITRKLQACSPLSLIVFSFTLTFAAFDWIMSLDPHWYSTIFGVYFFAGCFLSGMAFMVLIFLRLHSGGLLTQVVTYEHFHDLGKLIFGFVVFWAYIGFSQFMLIWYSSIPEETLWFAHRWEHGWMPVSIFLVAGHFGLPFFFLLSSAVKRKRATLTLVCSWLLLVHYLDLYWLVMPNRGGFHPHYLDLLCLLGLGGVFLGVLGWAMRPNLVAIRDPRLPESLSYENV